jgi:Holliday junction resolvasome RuvABC endonuclease subunit
MLLQLIVKYEPNVLVLEDLKSMRNAHTVRVLQRITGIVIEVCESHHLPYREYLTVVFGQNCVLLKLVNEVELQNLI